MEIEKTKFLFTATELRKLMTRQSFQPFRIIMSSGEKYEVANGSILHTAQIEDLQVA